MKTISAIGLLFFFFSVFLYAQDNKIIHEVKVYKIIGNKELITDVFHQAESIRDRPAIAFFHGGGWSGGDRSEFYEACKRYAEKGFVTLSFEYRLCVTEDGKIPNPEITPVECVKDARSALRWMKENAASLKIDPNRIVVAGQSAGGQLAWGTAMFDDINEESDNRDISPEPDALLLFSSNLNMVEAWAL
jgi:acetyl esterase/lipase